MLEPAKTVIDICGGVAATAHLTNRSVSRVLRWTYPKERGGTGGLIPADVAAELYAAAQDAEIPLHPKHFFKAVDGA